MNEPPELPAAPAPGLGWEDTEHDAPPVPVPSVTWDPCELDALEDTVREHLARGLPLRPLVAGLVDQGVRAELARLRQETVVAVLGEIMRTANWQMSGYALAFAANLHVTMGLSGTKIAAQFRVRKQDFYNLVQDIRARLGLPEHLPNARPPSARQQMAERVRRA